MGTVGQKEKKMQQRLVAFFRERLGHACLGDWSDRESNSNVEEDRRVFKPAASQVRIVPRAAERGLGSPRACKMATSLASASAARS